MTHILFICLGNICRSAMAEYIFKDLATKAGYRQFEVDSAATSNYEIGNPIYPPAHDKLMEHGIEVTCHRARQMEKADYEKYDYLIAMDESNLRDLKPFVGDDPQHKVTLLLDHTPASDKAHHNRGIADPWYTHNFDTAYEDIVAGCTALLKELGDKREQY